MFFPNFPSSIFLKNIHRGYCVGLGISLKTFTIKYLLCSLSKEQATPDFAVKFTAVERLEQDKIHLSVLRPVLPKACAKLFYDMPIYTQAGVFYGKIKQIEIDGGSLVRLFTDNAQLSAREISACADAVILRKSQPYPLGQRIPAYGKQVNSAIVTKGILRSAIQKNELIKLTLSLAPFSIHD